MTHASDSDDAIPVEQIVAHRQHSLLQTTLRPNKHALTPLAAPLSLADYRQIQDFPNVAQTLPGACCGLRFRCNGLGRTGPAVRPDGPRYGLSASRRQQR